MAKLIKYNNGVVVHVSNDRGLGSNVRIEGAEVETEVEGDFDEVQLKAEAKKHKEEVEKRKDDIIKENSSPGKPQ